MTIAQLHREALTLLRAAQWDETEARGVARLLTDEAAGEAFAHLSQPEKTLSEDKIERWREQLNRVAWGEPLPYVLGRREFYGLEFECDARALIPRPETELLVEFARERLEDYPAPRLADLGTGSGCIAVALAYHLPAAEIWATDISPAALELARANAAKHAVQNRAHFLPGESENWAAPLKGLKFDVVLSNPPYIPRADIAKLQSSVRGHEPHLALDGGADGLGCYRQMATQCQGLLEESGVLAVELGAGQWNEVARLFQEAGWQTEEPLFDWQEIARVLVARLK